MGILIGIYLARFFIALFWFGIPCGFALAALIAGFTSHMGERERKKVQALIRERLVKQAGILGDGNQEKRKTTSVILPNDDVAKVWIFSFGLVVLSDDGLRVRDCKGNDFFMKRYRKYVKNLDHDDLTALETALHNGEAKLTKESTILEFQLLFEKIGTDEHVEPSLRSKRAV
ncbi:MAG: hypothetical protein JW839_18625 [Candidatus Lokiarchaeota archaeon]|nr:hypothetical protein [Candidatus Lokiarchaeota archaeon]